MIATVPINLHRSDGLPSDRWRLQCINALKGITYPMCKCKAAHASAHDVYCDEARKALELLEIEMMGFGGFYG